MGEKEGLRLSASDIYCIGFSEALDCLERIFSKMIEKEKIPKECKDCKFVEEIVKINSCIKEKRLEDIESKLQYCAP